MRAEFHKKQRRAGIVEKIGLTVFIGSWADILVTHKVSPGLEFGGVVLGLLLLVISVRLTPYE